MDRVHKHVKRAVHQIYQGTTPEALRQKGIDVYLGAARFIDSSEILAGGPTLQARHFLITTGARPVVPEISGLSSVPFVTYQEIFDNQRLPRSMVIVGGGPLGAEIAQAYQRLGAQVTVIADRLLPKEDQDVRDLMEHVFAEEGIRRVKGPPKPPRNHAPFILLQPTHHTP